MTAHMRQKRGAAPVGVMEDLPPSEALMIRALRLWCEGPEGQELLATEFAERSGPLAARRTMKLLGGMMRLMLDHARRPLMRHGRNCRCVGSDEALFAQLVTSATQDEREDTMMLSMLIVRADLAPALCASAQDLGLELMRLGLRRPEHGPSPSAGHTLH